jgi:uncharacterized protein (TIRG00374 family)
MQPEITRSSMGLQMALDPDLGLEPDAEDPENIVAFGKQRLRWREFLISFIVTAALCVFLYLRMDVSAFTDGLKKANYLLLIPAVILTSVAWLIRAVRWKVLLNPFAEVPLSEAFRVLMVSASIGVIVPARAGELWRAHAMGRQTGLSRSTVLGTVVVERLIDGIMLIFMALLALILIGPSSAIAILVGSMAAGFIVATAFVMVLTRSPSAQDWATRQLIRIAPAKMKGVLAEKASLFMHGLSSLRDNRILLSASGLTIAIYLLDAFIYWMMGQSFGLDVSAAGYLLVVVISNLAVAIPISIGGVGPYEFFVQQVLVLQDAHAELALALALFMHVLLLAVPMFWGVMGIWRGAPKPALPRPIDAPLAREPQ